MNNILLSLVVVFGYIAVMGAIFAACTLAAGYLWTDDDDE